MTVAEYSPYDVGPFMKFLTVLACAIVAGCGTAYISPSVQEVTKVSNQNSRVQVVLLTAATVRQANQFKYTPRRLPPVFSSVTSVPGARNASALVMHIPPELADTPYKIGIADVLLLATPSSDSTVDELSGLLAAQKKRQGYTVQDDGAIAVANVGRILVSGLTLKEAEMEIFQALVNSQFNPTFSLEISEFNAQRVSVGGSVANPILVPITLKPLYLQEALKVAGGVTGFDLDFVSIRLYRDGTVFQIPLKQLYGAENLRRIRLQDGDSIFVDNSYELILAQANETRDNFTSKSDFDAVHRDYVYLSGEVAQQGRFTLPFEHKASLADALFSQAGISTREGNVSQIYLLRNNREGNMITAYHLDARNAANLVLATGLELRPNDIIFVAEQPITKWNRVIAQIVPSLITATAAALQ